MPSFTATAPGKIILFGEHAVVYGEPAIAVPVKSVQARAIVSPHPRGKTGDIWIEAPDINLSSPIDQLPADHPLKAALQIILGKRHTIEEYSPACRIQVTSDIPPASGLGSSAAISTALIRAYSAFLGMRLSDEQVSEKAFMVEKIHHGDPSGIDNAVISFQEPIFYRKGAPFEILAVGRPFSMLVVNSGESGNTREAVEGVRRKWERDPEEYNRIFSRMGEISLAAKSHIESGAPERLGPLMDENHELLAEIGVSTPKLDQLVLAAKEAGALGAKLSGGGLGGHLIALIAGKGKAIGEKMVKAGAASALITPVERRARNA